MGYGQVNSVYKKTTYESFIIQNTEQPYASKRKQGSTVCPKMEGYSKAILTYTGDFDQMAIEPNLSSKIESGSTLTLPFTLRWIQQTGDYTSISIQYLPD